MSLDTYANLKLEIAAWSARAGTDVTTGGIDTYIDVAESWFNRNLRVRQMVTSATLTVSGTGAITHPSDWLAWKQVTVQTTPITVLPVTSEGGALMADNTNAAGYPRKVIVRGTTSQVWPAPDGAYTYNGLYFASIPALSGSQTTNWLLTAYPEAYLFGSLALGAAYLQDDPSTGKWQAAFDRVVSEIIAASAADEYGTGVDSPMIRNIV